MKKLFFLLAIPLLACAQGKSDEMAPLSYWRALKYQDTLAVLQHQRDSLIVLAKTFKSAKSKITTQSEITYKFSDAMKMIDYLDAVQAIEQKIAVLKNQLAQ
jgi:hypothetical protein